MSGRSPSLAARSATIRAFSHARRVHYSIPELDHRPRNPKPAVPSAIEADPVEEPPVNFLCRGFADRALSHSARPPVGPRRPSPPTLGRAGRHVERASAGNGLSGHVSGELFKMMAGVDMVHVPYRGEAPALTDLIGGQVQGDIRQLAHIDRAH